MSATYSLHYGKDVSSHKGLGGLALEMVERWLVNPDPTVHVKVYENGDERSISEHEFNALLNLLVEHAREHRAQQASIFEEFAYAV